jgi:hypothetical protein
MRRGNELEDDSSWKVTRLIRYFFDSPGRKPRDLRFPKFPKFVKLSGIFYSLRPANGIVTHQMPVYHFTLHAYRSWSPNHRRGYTEQGKGYQPPNQERADQYDNNAKQEKATFDEEVQRILVAGADDICRRRGWRLHGVGTDLSHGHFVISWTSFIPWDEVMGKLKNVLSFLINRARKEKGRRWFVAGGSRKRVEDPSHLKYLLDTYLPDHPGIFWREGMPLPEVDLGE